MGFLYDQAVRNNSLFVGITETWLHDGVFDAEVTHSFPGYSLHRSDRAGGRQGGGVALFIRDDLSCDILASYAAAQPLRGGSVCELIVAKIHQLDTVVCVLYRPPDTRLEEFSDLLKSLDSTLAALPSPAPTVIVMGDLNFPKSCITWRSSDEGLLVPVVGGHRNCETAGGKQDRLQAEKMIALAGKYALLQQVENATHAVETLDLVFTNHCELVNTTLVEDWPSFSDHRLVIVHTYYKLKVENRVKEEQFLCEIGRRYKALNFHLAPWSDLKNEFSNIDWGNMQQLAETSPCAALSEFHTKILDVLEKLVPAKKEKRKGKPRMHRMHRLLWKRHAKAKKKFRAAQSIHTLSENLQKMWEIEKQLKADYTAINNMEEDEAILRIKSNSKVFFSFARSRQKIKAKVGPFLDPSTNTPNSSPDFAAEALRKQYDSVFAVPRPSWIVSDRAEHFKEEGGVSSLHDIQFGPAHIEKACAELRSTAAPGPDGVPASLLKNCSKQLSKPLYLLWRGSLDSGVIPPDLLLVMICPIHKGGSRAIPKNYRPVALTSHLIKVFERVLRWELVSHIEKLGILPEGQHGSRSMRSTLTQLLSHWDSILDGLESGEGVDSVYLDFSKAFDKVETGVLLHKLRDSKVLGKVGCWLGAFLDSAHRQQAVVVDGRLSSLSPVISGVPQGTVLGPILFLIHIADIARGVSSSTIASSYVDDTRVCRSMKDVSNDCQQLQSDLSSIYDWAADVNMTFNSDKFECLRYWPKKNKPEFDYKSPDGSIIEEKQHLRDLGVEMASDLTFSIHIQNTVSGANKLIGWALRTFRRRSKQVMLTIWKSIIQAKLDYTSQLWSPRDQASIGSLESLARNFTSKIEGLGHLDYWERLQALKLFSQERRRERYQIIFIWKIAQGLVQGYHASFVQSDRRGRQMVLAPLCNRAAASVRNAREASLQVRGAKLFNCIPRELRDTFSGTTEQFKAKLDAWLETIPDQPTIPGRQRAAVTNSLLDQVTILQNL